MARPVATGLMLAPDEDFLRDTAALAQQADYWAVSPETLWQPGSLAPNRFHRRLRALLQLRRRDVVAHTVTMSPGSRPPGRQAALRALARDHRIFDFAWLTAHQGFAATAVEVLHLPLALPHCEAATAMLRSSCSQLAHIGCEVGLENAVAYAHPTGVLADARQLASVGGPVLLDLHNLWVTAHNAGLQVEALLGALPLERVVELHVSGGSLSPPAWPLSRRLRLDSHDTAVPEPVWDLLEAVGPRCPHLRGVTLERLEHTGTGSLAGELGRIRDTVASWRSAPRRFEVPAAELPEPGALEAYQHALAQVLRAWDPRRALAEVVAPEPVQRWLAALDPDGVVASARLVMRLRLDRLVQGAPEVGEALQSAPEQLAERFRAYHAAVPSPGWMPLDEARCWARYSHSEASP